MREISIDELVYNKREDCLYYYIPDSSKISFVEIAIVGHRKTIEFYYTNRYVSVPGIATRIGGKTYNGWLFSPNFYVEGCNYLYVVNKADPCKWYI